MQDLIKTYYGCIQLLTFRASHEACLVTELLRLKIIIQDDDRLSQYAKVLLLEEHRTSFNYVLRKRILRGF